MRKVVFPKYEVIIWVIMIATFFFFATGSFGIHSLESIAKLLLAGALWLTVFLFPLRYFKRNDFDHLVITFLIIILALTLIAVIRTAIKPLEGPVGSKWTTLFGNQDCMFMLLTPCFLLLSQGIRSVSVLLKASEVYMFLGLFALITGQLYPIYSILWFTGLLYPYMQKGFKLIFFVSLAAAFINAFMFEETDRSVILLFAILIVAYSLVYVVKNRKLILIVCLVMMIVPIVYALMTMFIPDFSAVQIALEAVLNKTGNETLATDTRTFLFREMAEDLTNSQSWLLGKGAVSHYYSEYFARSTSGKGDYWERISVEVTLLQFLLRSGLIYVITYFSVVFYAVRKALKRAQSKFLLCVAVVASGWIMFACITYLNGCNFIHLGFFLLLGCCLSKRWLGYSDADIENILK